ncbi:saccharopine dehydrogenase [Hesseltinella vesiculosa]|uniref:Saccharopine dehydrogenase n=1 Tax=Hesseltinella vesiculosa TaxID=101127 RepID=A0A1X2GXH1_9FUNG|nr:saccharopine dehydrogenase [Hesseltinella vesiculosa]
MSRKYDLVVYGAAGFTGATTCEYIAELKDKDLSWAIAGRSQAKLNKVKNDLIKIDPALETLDILLADSSQPESLDAFLKDTKVVISTVGPFLKYGTPLVEACIRHNTHYVDITGEYNWMKQLIDRYHTSAQANQTMIVPACGFDSVPSDIGVFMTVDYLRNHHNLDTANVKFSLVDVVGGVSGGTLQTMTEALADTSITVKQNVDPYLLAQQRGIDKASIPTMYRDRDFPGWQAFFIMAVTNEKVVRRSWSLYAERQQSYGRLFTYKETMSFSWLPAFLITAFVYLTPVAAVLLRFKWFKKIAQKYIVPSGGTGPTREQRAKGRFEAHIIAEAETEPYDAPVRARGIVRGFSDPGYSDTCVMLTQAALSIAKDHDRLPGKQGGILTPASAFGHVLIDRLNASRRMQLEVATLE